MVGTRADPRSITASPVPIDVITAQDFVSQGDVDLTNQLRTVVPSFNVNTQPISDAATVVRPANLRNMAPDHTLVLINGKRRQPRGGHRLAGQRHRGRLAGAGPVAHSLDRPAAGRGAARRRRGAVRLGRHRRRHQLRAEERALRGQHRVPHRPALHGERRRPGHVRRRRPLVQRHRRHGPGLHVRRQRRPPAGLGRLREPQPRVRRHAADQPRGERRRHAGGHQRRQHVRARHVAGMGLAAGR